MPNHNPTLGGGGFHHVAIRARDFDKSVHFYQDSLGFTERIAWGEPPKRAIMLDTGDGNYLEIFERPDQAPAAGEGSILHFALRTDDPDAVVERARAAGATITVEPKGITIASRPEPTPVRLAFFQGPDGEVVELFKNEKT
ncbi:MAG: VOC family protein [Phycisphaeraceae bacterium]